MQIHMHQDGMKLGKLLVTLVVSVLFFQCVSFFSLIPLCQADIPFTLYVGEGEKYIHIQDAIDNASNGYRIFVYNGTYYENITINKRIDLFGEDRRITFINGNGYDTVITVTAEHVNISHFTIQNGGNTRNDSIIQVNGAHAIITDNTLSDGYYGLFMNHTGDHLIYDNIIRSNTGDGIRLNHSNSNVNISYNTITGNRNGILLYASGNNKIYNNILQYNDANGIFLNRSSTSDTIANNNCSYNNHSGIYLNDYSDHSTLFTNQLYQNNQSGIAIENCSWAIITNENTVVRNTNYGMMIVGSNSIVQNNIINYNKKDGIFLSADNDNEISSNTIEYNTRAGIRLYNSTSDEIYSNEIAYNSQYGAYLDFFTIRNYFYNNYFHNNADNALDKSLNRNYWNITKQTGINIVGGGNISGNYWDDYDESSEGAYDSNQDGIADTPYIIYTINKDYGPILDVTKPQFGIPSVSPRSQSLGQYTTISITVTDNLEVRDVMLNITYLTSQGSSFSILQNKTGNIYSCRKQFSPIGNYTLIVAARDARNWNQSITSNFSIHQGEPPTITDNSLQTGSPSAIFTFNATVRAGETSAADLRVYVNWQHGSKADNNSMSSVSGNYFEKNITLDRSIQNLTYYLFACDEWGNRVKTSVKVVSVIDTDAPRITIIRHGQSFEDLPKSYTFEATVTDNCAVSDVSIEYWYDGSSKMIADMEYVSANYFKKVIVPQDDPDIVYCVIYATDTSGNTNNTKNPFAAHGGPYTGFVLEQMRFNGTGSFDLDGNISEYFWDFGDGTTGEGSTPTHTYLSSGTYPIILTVTDDEGRTGNSTTRIWVRSLIPHRIPWSQLDLINQRYNLSLQEQFYSYDSDGDGVNDSFIDPNNVLTLVHEHYLIINDNVCFLLSIGADDIPDFFWDTTIDTIVSISHTVGIITNIAISEDEGQATMDVTVDKDVWIYIDVEDKYPDSPVTITTQDRTISSDFIWRLHGKIYVLDDPEEEYQFIFDNIYPALEASFIPGEGGVIDENSPTITIEYNVPVSIISASFGDIIIELNDIVTDDNQVFIYTPPGNLENGTYPFDIAAQALAGDGFLSSSIVYFYFTYQFPPEKTYLEKNGLWILLGGFIGALVALLLFLKIKHVTVDAFVYFKNKKIIPFFKPIVVGPMSVRIQEKGLSKAEFYVDGKLKDTVTTTPCLWQWNEKAIMKHTLETRVYDEDGNSASSGEMEFYIFNPVKMKENE